MKNIKRKLVMAVTAGAVAVTGAVAAPQSASASNNNRVCLSSSSATYAYLSVTAEPGADGFVNRGGCSSNDWGYQLKEFRPASGYICRDQFGRTFFGGRWVSAWVYRNRTLTCKVDTGGGW